MSSVAISRVAQSTAERRLLADADRATGQPDNRTSASELKAFLDAHPARAAALEPGVAQALQRRIAGLAVPVTQPQAPVFRVPPSFDITEKIIAFTTTLELKSRSGRFGRVSKKLISLTPSFTLKNSSGEVVAKAKQKLLSWGVQIDVFDADDAKIGTIKEIVHKSLFKVETEYKILDGSGTRIATSHKSDWFATRFELTATDGHLLARMSRPALRIVDTWHADISDDSVVDPRVMVMIAAYKTNADIERREAEDD